MSVAVTAEGRPLAFEVIAKGRRDSGTDLLTLNVWKTADPLFLIRGTLVKVNFWDATLAAPFLYVVVFIAFVIL